MADNKHLIFDIPSELTSSADGYEYLSYISLTTWNTEKKTIIFNFAKIQNFEVNLCSPFAALLVGLIDRKNKITFVSVPSLVERDLEMYGFNHIINKKNILEEVSNSSILTLQKFALLDNVTFQQYVNDKLLSQKGFPYLSVVLAKKINKSIFEIFNNAHTHGKCEFVYTCGKYYAETGILKFTISDMGTTIRKSVNDFFESGNRISGVDAIGWAVQEGNTTKKGGIPGGLGLSLIRDFLRLNGGSIQIISSNGYWHEQNGAIFDQALRNRFLGTIVNIEFNLHDKKSYVLSSEIDPKNVL